LKIWVEREESELCILSLFKIPSGGSANNYAIIDSHCEGKKQSLDSTQHGQPATGLIAGATGTRKTVTLRVLAEQFSDIGVPVFMADVKGDLSEWPCRAVIIPK